MDSVNQQQDFRELINTEEINSERKVENDKNDADTVVQIVGGCDDTKSMDKMDCQSLIDSAAIDTGTSEVNANGQIVQCKENSSEIGSGLEGKEQEVPSVIETNTTAPTQDGDNQKNVTMTFESLANKSDLSTTHVEVKEEDGGECDVKPAFNDMQVSSSSDTSSDSESEMGDADVESNPEVPVVETSKAGPTVPGELTVYDLPPLEDLKIALDEKVTLNVIGTVDSIVDCLVIVRANKGTPPLNEDSVLFREGRISLGKVFETFGPVVSPFYSVRFNSISDITKSSVKVGDEIFFAPREDKTLTTYVFLNHLRQMKGSDASWNCDHEPPEKHLDYSDDEEEKEAKRRHRERLRDEAGNELPSESADNPTEQEQNRNKRKPRGNQQSYRDHNTRHIRPSLVRPPAPGFIPGDHIQQRHRFPSPGPRHPYPPHQPRQWIDPDQQYGGQSGPHYRGPPPQHHYFGTPPQHFGGPPRHRHRQPFSQPPPFQGYNPRYNTAGYGQSDWQNYGATWTDQDNEYYATDAPPVPKTNFVDTRFVQQDGFESDKK